MAWLLWSVRRRLWTKLSSLRPHAASLLQRAVKTLKQMKAMRVPPTEMRLMMPLLVTLRLRMSMTQVMRAVMTALRLTTAMISIQQMVMWTSRLTMARTPTKKRMA
eukprot:Rmarinus@m.24132